ncbi:hypothetical protein DFJ74DRAFT_703964 [Hyaloraphidium curvatum]|nr:hypothetical protein DFJ74DRAFT_703964 [Hyaloraphidium curvatum]
MQLHAAVHASTGEKFPWAKDLKEFDDAFTNNMRYRYPANKQLVRTALDKAALARLSEAANFAGPWTFDVMDEDRWSQAAARYAKIRKERPGPLRADEVPFVTGSRRKIVEAAIEKQRFLDDARALHRTIEDRDMPIDVVRFGLGLTRAFDPVQRWTQCESKDLVKFVLLHRIGHDDMVARLVELEPITNIYTFGRGGSLFEVFADIDTVYLYLIGEDMEVRKRGSKLVEDVLSMLENLRGEDIDDWTDANWDLFEKFRKSPFTKQQVEMVEIPEHSYE